MKNKNLRQPDKPKKIKKGQNFMKNKNLRQPDKPYLKLTLLSSPLAFFS